MDHLFTFLDGALTYDCVTCGQACCRGKGMALDAHQELVPLLTREPRLAPLLSAVPGGLAGWADVTDGCWFLRDDGWCRIEKADGRLAKPHTCRLFPFNRLFLVGGVRVVDFNSVICPIQDAAETGRPGVTYAELIEDLKHAPAGPLTTSQVPMPAGADARWADLERAIVDASRDYLDRKCSDFLGFQLAAAEASLAGRSPAGADPGAARSALGALDDRWARFFGTPSDTPAAARVARTLALVGPSLRFNTLFRRGGPPWATAVRRLPRQLLATAHFARVASEVAGRHSLRAVTELHQHTLAQRELLAHWDDRAVALSMPSLEGAPEPLAAAVRAVLARLAPFAGPAAPLGDVLEGMWGTLPPPARALAFALLARSGADLRFEDA